MPDKTTFPERMKAAIMTMGGITKASQKTGLSTSVLSQYSNGKSEPSRTRLISVAQGAGCSLGWLAMGEEDRIDPQLHMLPRYKTNLEAGNQPAKNRLIKQASIPITDEFLKNELGRDYVDDLSVFDINGDWMSPTLSQGDWVIADLGCTKMTSGIYIAESENETYFRRIQELMGNSKSYKVICDNKALYEPETVTEEDLHNTQILGRVIWHGHRM